VGEEKYPQKDLEFLEDAMMHWRRYYKQIVVKEAKREV